ncbi:putative inhibitor of apoptosis [Saccostrea echinata]|uniref:putative inhibitor of apoptosis n=1 Tax=Saccostrea echinata TaxID=191078 RepID=UPI002A83F5F4|nr:putative inhibitor of apoptosis [Saccostrea echinata]
MENLSGKRNVSLGELCSRSSTLGTTCSNISIIEICVTEIHLYRQGGWTPVEPKENESKSKTVWKCRCCGHQCSEIKVGSGFQQTAMENKETQTINDDESKHFIIEEIFERFLNSYLENTVLKSNVSKPYMLLKDIKYLDKSNIYQNMEKESSFLSLKGKTSYEKVTDLVTFLIKHFQWLKPINFHVYPVQDCSRNLEEFVKRELSSSRSSMSPTGLQSTSELHSMNMEMIRVFTYSNFPLACSVSTLRLAKEGFYYTGEGDTVACFACGHQTHGLELANDPRGIHQQTSPNCPFLNSGQSRNVPFGENETVGNMPVRENNGRTHSPVGRRQEVLQNSTPAPITEDVSSCSHQKNMEQNANSKRKEIKTTHQKARERQKKINNFIKSLDPLGISFDRPKYPSYAVMATRVSSFKDWPSSIMQKPRDLAMAGFIYAGYGDYTRCFFCGGGLRNWEPQDKPWKEHARWFPKCAFLRQNKGDEFVAMVQIEHEEEEELAESAEQSSPHTNSASAIPRTELKNEVLADVFDLSSVQSVLQMGYSHEMVKEAFELLKLTKHVGEISGGDIMDVILSNEENTKALETTPTAGNTRIQTKATVRLQSPAPPNQSDTEYTQSLIEEYRELRNLRVCKICRENDASIAMLPCGHLCCCPDCAPAMRNCPICGQFVKGTVRTWLA